MTHDTPSRPEDARGLQAKLYREIGISAVAAALHFTTQPDPAPRAPGGVDKGGLDKAAPQPQLPKRAA